MELHAEGKTVNEIFSPAFKYVIPRFQREFSWGDEELEDFWDDIYSQISFKEGEGFQNKEYFIGCIVLVGDSKGSFYTIVDGQQRLTTITILLRSIIQKLHDLGQEKQAKALQNCIEGQDLDTGDPFFKLNTESPKPFFQNEIQSFPHQEISEPSTDEEYRLLHTFNFFKEKIDSSLSQFCGNDQKSTALSAIRDQVLKHLKVVRVTTDSEEEAYIVFEILNARGLSLSSTDLIKNWIFKNYPDTHPHDNAKEIWREIRNRISDIADMEMFFRHYWNSRYPMSSSERLYKSFKKSQKSGEIKAARDFLMETNNASKVYKKICSPSADDWGSQKEKRVTESLQRLSEYKILVVRPFLMSLIHCREKKHVNETRFIKALGYLDMFHLVFSKICQSKSSGLNKSYASFGRRLYELSQKSKSTSAASNGCARLLDELLGFLDSKKPKKSVLEISLERKEYGSDTKLIKTVFNKLEKHAWGRSGVVSLDFSIEHVLDRSQRGSDKISNLIPLEDKINNEIPEGTSFEDKLSKYYSKSSLKVTQAFCKLFSGCKSWASSEQSRWLDYLAQQLDEAARL